MPVDPQVAVRLARLFFEAGFLEPNYYTDLLVQVGAERPSWQQFLEQDITSASFRLPSRRGARVEAVERLSQPVSITLPEIIYIVSTFKPDPEELMDFLVECAVLTNTRAESIKARVRNQDDLLKVLVDERLLSPRVLAELAVNPANYKAREIREQAASDILVYNDAVDVDDLAHVVNKSHHLEVPVYENLHALMTQQELVKSITQTFRLPELELKTELVASDWEELFPMEMMERLRFIPVEHTADHCTIAVADPLDFSAADVLSILTGLSFSQVRVPAADMARMLQESLGDAEAGALANRDVDFADTPTFEVQSLDLGSEQLSAVDLVRRMLESAVSTNATDIHLERVSNIMRVRFRVDGALRNVLEIAADRAEAVVSRIKVLCNLDVTERRRPQDGHFTVEDSTQRFDFRVSTFPTVRGEKLVLRVLDAVTIVRSMSDLGMSGSQEQLYRRSLARPHGLCLVAGPTGAGKTSTLYAGITQLNTVEKNIITIEDPVEYRLEGIAQLQVDNHMELTFANGLRSALRQDPDVIMVGEIRDPETASIGVRAALTGHLVLSTIHANSAISAISSLRFLGTQPYLLTGSMLLIIAQRLVRTICDDCREVVDCPPSLLSDLDLAAGYEGHFFQGAGCQKCFYSGYRGRTGIFELLPMSHALKASIVEGADEAHLMAVALSDGFEPMRFHARQKVIEGRTSPAEALKECFMIS